MLHSIFLKNSYVVKQENSFVDSYPATFLGKCNVYACILHTLVFESSVITYILRMSYFTNTGNSTVRTNSKYEFAT